MTNRVRPRRRPRLTAHRATTVLALITAAALATVLLTGCDPTDTANSSACGRSWTTIADSLKAIHEAGAEAAKDPGRTDDSIATIDERLDRIDATDTDSDDSETARAVDDLDQAISDYNTSILHGDTHPDTSGIDTAADRLKDLCTP
ncbi:hypothetical protein [Streptomyces sp. NPDC005423]|uniref:hypothetical protein n=1 Tax=Streptomyces sp. NPDC005423 TaxID=3155343 RepID=UPI0033A52E15